MISKKEKFITGLFLLLINFVGALGLYMWWQNHHRAVIVPTIAQTNVVATETNNNLVPSGTNTPEGISFKGKVQSGWGETNNK